MKKLIALLVFIPTTAFSQEVYPINVNRLCAAIVGIPYASDNFTDKEWEEFKECLEFVKYFGD
jgi:hypothetical protein